MHFPLDTGSLSSSRPDTQACTSSIAILGIKTNFYCRGVALVEWTEECRTSVCAVAVDGFPKLGRSDVGVLFEDRVKGGFRVEADLLGDG